MENIDEFFLNSPYKILRILLSGSGLWPFLTISKRYAIYIVMVIVLGSGFTFELLGVMEVWHDSLELVDCIPMLLLDIVVIIKTIYVVHSLPKIKILLIKMMKYCLSPKSNEEIKIQNSHALFGRNLGYAYTGILLGHVIMFIFASLLTRLIRSESDKNDALLNKVKGTPPGLLYRVNYMVDTDTYFIPIFIHTTTSHIFYMMLIVVFDVLYLTMIEHCCGMFEALRYRLKNAFKFENDSDNSTRIFLKDKSYLNVAYSVRRHAEAMQFVAIMDSLYSIPLFVHVGCAILMLSIIGYQVVTNTEDINRLLKHSSYLSGILINIFFENWQGQKIIDSSERVFESAYNCEWYHMSIAARKLLLMIMLKSERPLILTAGKFIVLSYTTFSTVIRTSSSYFMLLRSMS